MKSWRLATKTRLFSVAFGTRSAVTEADSSSLQGETKAVLVALIILGSLRSR
jgi:hypothetical protein